MPKRLRMALALLGFLVVFGATMGYVISNAIGGPDAP
jgi:hypothetical protein